MNFKHKYLFLLPGLLVLIGILIFPVGFTVRLSMSSWDSFFPGLDYVGLENYFRIFYPMELDELYSAPNQKMLIYYQITGYRKNLQKVLILDVRLAYFEFFS